MGPSRIERVTAIAIAVIYGTDILRLFFSSTNGEPLFEFRALSLMIYAVTAAMLLSRPRIAAAQLRRAPLLALLLLLPMVSMLWSASMKDTGIRAFTMLGSCLFGYYLASRYSPRELLRLLMHASTWMALLSLLLIVALPAYGVHSGESWAGTWRGAYVHKNGFGAGMAFAAGFLSLGLIYRVGGNRSGTIMALLLCFALLLGSRSATSLVAFTFSMVCVGLARLLLGPLRPLLLPGVVVIAPMLLVGLVLLDADMIADFTALLGKDASFSGRLPLWKSAWPWIEIRPWLGYGYEAFWTDAQTPVRIIMLQIFYRPFYSHNGMIELLLSLGVLGASVFAGLLVVFTFRILRTLTVDPRGMLGAMVLVFSVSFFARNVAEVSILTRNDLVWCLFVAFYLMLVPRIAPALSHHRHGAGSRPVSLRPMAWIAAPAGRTA